MNEHVFIYKKTGEEIIIGTKQDNLEFTVVGRMGWRDTLRVLWLILIKRRGFVFTWR